MNLVLMMKLMSARLTGVQRLSKTSATGFYWTGFSLVSAFLQPLACWDFCFLFFFNQTKSSQKAKNYFRLYSCLYMLIILHIIVVCFQYNKCNVMTSSLTIRQNMTVNIAKYCFISNVPPNIYQSHDIVS